MGKSKKEAAAVLDAMGLTVSDAFRMLLTRIAKERALPFEPWCQMKRPFKPCRKPGLEESERPNP